MVVGVVRVSSVENGAIFVWCLGSGPLVALFSEISFVVRI